MRYQPNYGLPSARGSIGVRERLRACQLAAMIGLNDRRSEVMKNVQRIFGFTALLLFAFGSVPAQHTYSAICDGSGGEERHPSP
jgi:hypothetical protein